MKTFTPEISWHERDPIYSCSFHPLKQNNYATAESKGIIRLWELKLVDDNEKLQPDFVATLNRHTKAVNIIRWNHDGKTLASAGDEGVIFLWNENEIKNQKTLDMNEDEANKENWFVFKTLRGHLEDVYDLCWSRDGTTLISGSVDNSAIVWDVASGNKKTILKEPKGFVHGVTYDPLGAYYAILSTDRSLRFYSTSSNRCIFNVNKMSMTKDVDGAMSSTRLFYDDTMKSFCRRLCFSNDGNLIIVPAGCLELDDKIINATFLFTRTNLQKPCFYLPHDKPSLAVAVCPLKFQLMTEKCDDIFVLPYRIVYAIATEDSIFLYDTQHLTPIAYVTDIHYASLTDICWSHTGRMLSVTSMDGFCTFVYFGENELGTIYETSNQEQIENVSSGDVTKPNATIRRESQSNAVNKMFNNVKTNNSENKLTQKIKLTSL